MDEIQANVFLWRWSNG